MQIIYTNEEVIKLIEEHAQANYCYGDEKAKADYSKYEFPNHIRVDITTPKESE